MLNCSRSLNLGRKFWEFFALLFRFHQTTAVTELLSVLQINRVKAGLVHRFEFALQPEISSYISELSLRSHHQRGYVKYSICESSRLFREVQADSYLRGRR